MCQLKQNDGGSRHGDGNSENWKAVGLVISKHDILCEMVA